MEKKQAKDPFKNLKYKGYCLALTPPGDSTTFDDFVKFAKFFLCRHANRLWKDPIWEDYTDEEIIIEYFAHFFQQNKEEREKFEVELGGGVTDREEIYDWLDKQVEKNQKEMSEQLENMPDKVSFSPEKGEDKEE